MALITFNTEEAHSAFHSMAEGMWEIARDDYVTPDNSGRESISDMPAGPHAALYESLISATAWQKGADYPLAFPLSPGLAAVAQNVLDNMDDNERLDLDEPETYAAGRHQIALTDGTPLLGHSRGEMGAEEALQEAIAILELRCSETDTASPEGWRARCALQTLQDILAQRGCDDPSFHGNAPDGKLTTLIDVIVFG